MVLFKNYFNFSSGHARIRFIVFFNEHFSCGNVEICAVDDAVLELSRNN